MLLTPCRCVGGCSISIAKELNHRRKKPKKYFFNLPAWKFSRQLLLLGMFNNLNASLLKLHFSDREINVLDLIAEGLTNQEIGDKLYISRRTVEGIRLSLLSKTGTKNTASLMAFAFRSGILV